MTVSPCLTRAQNAFTRADRSAVSTITAIARKVTVNSANCGCWAKNERSNAFSCEKSGGFGNTPWVNANVRTTTAIESPTAASTANSAATAEYLDAGIEVLVR